MFLLHRLTDYLRKRFPAQPLQERPSTQLRLEPLEDRLTPNAPALAFTYTDAAVHITPNLAAFSVTEAVTATVTTIPSLSINGSIIPVPAGASTPTGTILFNLNNQQQSAALNANGQATAVFTLPLTALFTGQGLKIQYPGALITRSFFDSLEYWPSTFEAPLYLNFDNLFFPANLTFGQLTFRQQMNSYDNYGQVTAVPSYYTAQGETDSLGLLAFQYVDPGIINSMTVMGINLPGIFALAVGAYNEYPISSLSSTGSS